MVGAKRDPVKVEVRFVPSTGEKRPYELWLTSGAGHDYQRGSFSSEASANKKAEAVRRVFKLT
jgi:hypothetical protein